ncbi:hypothetical protein TcWFU_010091 [Taenia crassiceps]|uniref:Uncharacterized protein n=1 Tax=Taenia crassiceps TaxID=6207 RepID=A0ABR4QJ26_9CEST
MRSIIRPITKIDLVLSRAVLAASLSTGEKPGSIVSSAAPEMEVVDITDAYAAGVRSGELAQDPLALARFIAARVVAFGRHFLLIEKPPNLSVWGHALSTSPHLTGAKTSQTAPLSLRECLPHLRSLLAEEGPNAFAPPSAHGSDSDKSLSALVAEKTPRSFSDAWTPPSELFIAESLPAAYSGLILLATSAAYADFARAFYSNASRNCFPGSMYQTFHVVSWGHPSRDHVKNERFPLAVHKASDSISVSYRPTDDKITRVAHKRGKLVYKHVSHRLLCCNSARHIGCLIELTCNSCYAGLPEVYLLHEGCEVVGEDLQASRLVYTSGTPMVLSPTMARLGVPLPKELVSALGGGNLQRATLPTHIYRSQLLIPPPLPPGPKKDIFTRKAKGPMGCIISTQKNRPVLLWKSFPFNAKRDVFFLSALSPSLPPYFIQTLKKLGLTSYPRTDVEDSHWQEYLTMSSNKEIVEESIKSRTQNAADIILATLNCDHLKSCFCYAFVLIESVKKVQHP